MITGQVMRRQPGFHIESNGGTRTIKPLCDLSRHVAEMFRRLLLSELRSPYRQYRIDLSSVDQIDPACLSVLMCFWRMLRHRQAEGVTIDIVGAVESVRAELSRHDIPCADSVSALA